MSVSRIALIAGPVLALSVTLSLRFQFGWELATANTLGVTLLCVVWWIFEPIPIPATSLVPFTLLPLLGVITEKDVALAYGNSLVLLLMGGFLLSTALARSGAHRRLALGMVRLSGGRSSRMVVFGFMAASSLISLWISNSATTLMLLPIALALVEKSPDPKLAAPLFLGIAYAASIGGIGTPVGTPGNLVFMGVYTQTTGKVFTFTDWMRVGMPVVLIMVPLVWLWLTRNLDYRGKYELPEMGSWTSPERRVLTVFAIVAMAWVTRSEPFGGWSVWFDLPGANDAMVAFLGVISLFLIPNGQGERLLDWETAKEIPWGVLLLFGAGIAIANAFQSSGLSTSIGSALSGLSVLPTLGIIACICLAVTFLTETTSNTATTTLLMPILATAAVAANLDPVLFMIPAAMSASCAFMLPVATAPNAVVFSTGTFTTSFMAREGLAVNFIGALVITTVCYLLLV